MDKQRQVLIYLSSVESATIDQIYENVSFGYYCNENKHLGALLSRMVKTGKIERVKKGLFKFKNARGFNLKDERNNNQLSLL